MYFLVEIKIRRCVMNLCLKTFFFSQDTLKKKSYSREVGNMFLRIFVLYWSVAFLSNSVTDCNDIQTVSYSLFYVKSNITMQNTVSLCCSESYWYVFRSNKKLYNKNQIWPAVYKAADQMLQLQDWTVDWTWFERNFTLL